MKCQNLFLALTILFALVTTLSSTLTEDQTANILDHDNDDEDDPSDSLNVLDHDNDDEVGPSDSLYILDHDSDDEDDPSNSLIESSLGSDHEAYISLRGANRFLSQRKTRAKMTCKKYPRICRAKGSPGPDCCKKKCVNLLADRRHCGRCGKKCKYNEICCKGKCVNPLKHNKHCGGCGNSCGKGSSCGFGICGYA